MNGIRPTLNFAEISQAEVEPDRCPAVRAYPKQTRQTLEHCPTLTDAGRLAVHRPAAEVAQRAMLLQPFDGGGQQGDSHPPPQVLEDGLGIIVPADDEDWTAVPGELPPHPRLTPGRPLVLEIGSRRPVGGLRSRKTIPSGEMPLAFSCSQERQPAATGRPRARKWLKQDMTPSSWARRLGLLTRERESIRSAHWE